jgi:hypothetical protein
MTRILAFDPSGNFHEGKGTTGVAIAEGDQPISVGRIHAGDFKADVDYWKAHTDLIGELSPDYFVFEGYRLYNHKGMAASSQANSILETPQLIGILKLTAHTQGIPTQIYFAKDVKTRWSDDVLVNKGLLVPQGDRLLFNGRPTVTHERDALRHLMHFIRYGGK